MKIQLINIPDKTMVKQATLSNDFEECYRLNFISNKNIKLETIVYDCFSSFTSGWVDSLFKIRNKLVKPLGLKVAPDEKTKPIHRLPITENGYVSFFKVKGINQEEVLLYAEDSHLSAYFSIILSQNGDSKNLYACTTVQMRNTVGKAYFAVVKPFHKLIIKNMMRNAAKHYSDIKHTYHK